MEIYENLEKEARKKDLQGVELPTLFQFFHQQWQGFELLKVNWVHHRSNEAPRDAIETLSEAM